MNLATKSLNTIICNNLAISPVHNVAKICITKNAIKKSSKPHDDFLIRRHVSKKYAC